MRNNSLVFVVTIISFFLLKCAHQIAPSGGEEDKIPPEITEFYPPNGTVNFNGEFFEMTFSEYVQKSSVREAIFISPKIKGELEYSWSGKTLEIAFEDSLRKNTTYTVTIGTDVQDYNNRNKMAQAFTSVFSTGTKIDKGEISGRIYNDKPIGVMVYVYRENDTIINPLQQEPDYISQVGENGKFSIKGLAPGKYNLLAIRDDFRNYLYNIGEDEYGTTDREIFLTEKDSVINDLSIMLTKEDTIPPNILSVTMTDEAHLQIEFSEYIDSSKITADKFYIYDSTANQKKELEYFYKGIGKPKHIFASFADSLLTDNENFLISEELYDLYGNRASLSITPFVVNENPDTVAPNLRNALTEFGNNFIDYEFPWTELVFDDGFDTKAAGLFTHFYLEDEKIPVKPEAPDNSILRIIPEKKLKDNKEYQLKIDLSKVVDSKGNFIDSVHTVKLQTKNKLDFSGASGRVEIADKTKVKVNLKSVDTQKKTYSVDVDDNGFFNFPRVIPGKYILWTYADKDGNSIFSFGKVFPYSHAEKFVFYPDTLELKPRWPVGDIEIKF